MKTNLKIIKYVACSLFFLLILMPNLSFAVDKAELYVFFKDLCDACHGATPTHNIESARIGYEQSGHKNNGNSFYANGNGCQQCHTHEGFVEFTKNGSVDPKSYVEMPSQPNCNTCHDPHTNGDMSLRKTASQKLANGKEYSLGSGDLCGNCHQVRGKASETVKSIPAKDLASHWGPHHGPQTDMLIGTNAYEFDGKTYYSSVHSTLIKNGCAECHMKFPKGRFSFSKDMAGHSFSLVGEVHHQPKLNNAGCLGQCHTKVGQIKAVNKDTPVNTFSWHQTEVVYDIPAKDDFDLDGKAEPLQAEVEGLLNYFVNKKGTGYLQKGDNPIYKKDGSWNRTRSEEKRSVEEVAALYNHKYVLEDRSRGIHNAPYTIQILYDSLTALDPGFDTSKRNVYKPPEEYKAPANAGD